MKSLFDYKDIAHRVDVLLYKDVYVGVVEDMSNSVSDEVVTIVELGAGSGVSARILYEALTDSSIEDFDLYLVDPVKREQTAVFGSLKEVIFIQDSAENFAYQMENNSIHLLHVDVDPHGYDQTLNLFSLYQNKMTKYGTIIFHDCTKRFGVLPAVEKIALLAEWTAEYCNPHPDFPISCPAIVRRNAI